MATPNVQARSGNRISVKIDGRAVGLIQSIDPNDDYAPEPASGVGDIHAQEYVPTMARHTINVSQMSLRNKSLRELGLIPENGDEMLRGLVFDIEVFDKAQNKLLRRYEKCSYASGSMQVNKHAIVVSNAVFQALDVAGNGA